MQKSKKFLRRILGDAFKNTSTESQLSENNKTSFPTVLLSLESNLPWAYSCVCEDLSKDRHPAAEAGVTAGDTHEQPKTASAIKPANLQFL